LSRLVWSARDGYPGHPDYREFHRDGIYDLPPHLADPWLAPSGTRLPSGLKYWRVTCHDGEKDWYEPETAAMRAREHAADFVGRITNSAETGLWFAPFDAELFGHWWFEGPLWLEQVLRRLAPLAEVDAQTATAAAMASTDAATGMPAASSWGMDGDNTYWINRETDWIYPQLFDAARRLERLLRKQARQPDDELRHRALRQAARTLLLAQASDWPFLIKSGTAAELARERLAGLLTRFGALCTAVEEEQVDIDQLRGFEAIDSAFPDLDLQRFGANSRDNSR
jgi:1,4-alpha-glucan branching enzyme